MIDANAILEVTRTLIGATEPYGDPKYDRAYYRYSQIASAFRAKVRDEGEHEIDLNKSEVTHEALCAVAQYLLFGGMEFRFQHKRQWYVMKIEETAERREE